MTTLRGVGMGVVRLILNTILSNLVVWCYLLSVGLVCVVARGSGFQTAQVRCGIGIMSCHSARRIQVRGFACF